MFEKIEMEDLLWLVLHEYIHIFEDEIISHTNIQKNSIINNFNDVVEIKELLLRYESLLNLINKLRKKKFTTEELKKLLWLKNSSNLEDIEIATHLIWNLIYFSQDEIKYLSELLYRQKIKKYLLSKIIADNNLKKYDYKSAYQKYWNLYISRSIFIALSDGAMIDYFKRVDNIDNKNVINYYKLHTDEQEKINIRYHFLIEDFGGTGTTFLRDDNNIQYWLKEENISKLDLYHQEQTDRNLFPTRKL